MKNVDKFLDFLVSENILTDYMKKYPTSNGNFDNGMPYKCSVTSINEGILGILVVTCGCKKCNEILEVQVLYNQKRLKEYANHISYHIKEKSQLEHVNIRQV